jgi:hypothetical protein
LAWGQLPVLKKKIDSFGTIMKEARLQEGETKRVGLRVGTASPIYRTEIVLALGKDHARKGVAEDAAAVLSYDAQSSRIKFCPP